MQQCGCVKPVNGIPPLSNWISDGNTYKQTIKIHRLDNLNLTIHNDTKEVNDNVKIERTTATHIESNTGESTR